MNAKELTELVLKLQREIQALRERVKAMEYGNKDRE